MIFKVNNATYDVPDVEAQAFFECAKQIPKEMIDQNGKKVRLSASLRSHGFSVILSEWAEREWGRYRGSTA